MNLVCRLDAELDRVDWTALAAVFERAPLGKRDPEILATTFRNSTCACIAYADDVIVGAGRALSDGMTYAFVLDVVVDPDFQGRGIGRSIMNYIGEHTGAKNLVLHSVPAMQPFYAKLGYRRMTTAMALFEKPDHWHSLGYIE